MKYNEGEVTKILSAVNELKMNISGGVRKKGLNGLTG